MKRKIPFETTILVVLIALLEFSCVSPLIQAEMDGWFLDVYTQKAPYDGRGLDKWSDSFATLDAVILYANVTFNGAPVQNVLVSFQVLGPPNSLHNISFYFSASTNSIGIANTSFTIPWPIEDPETTVFGVWAVFAYSDYASDSLFFRVGRIIDIVSLTGVDADPPQGGWLSVQLSLVNIAMTSKNATLVIVAFDSAGIINTLVVENLVISSLGANFSYVVQVPVWAKVGVGRVDVSVLTLAGAPYCPQVSASFFISLFGDLNFDGRVDIGDIARVEAAFGSFPGHPRWDVFADVSKDGRVDILDLALVSSCFGSFVV